MHLIILIITAASATVGYKAQLDSFLADNLSGWMYLESINPRMVPNRLLLPRMDAIQQVLTEVREMLKNADSRDPYSYSWDSVMDSSPDMSSGEYSWRIQRRPLVIPESDFLDSALYSLEKLTYILQNPPVSRNMNPSDRVKAVSESFNVVLYKLTLQAEYHLIGESQDVVMWRHLLRQLHYRSVIFFVWFGDPYTENWKRFSAFMTYGLGVLQHVVTGHNTGKTAEIKSCCSIFPRRCAAVSIDTAADLVTESTLSPRDFALTVNRKLDKLIENLKTVDSAAKGDQTRFTKSLLDYGALFFEVFAGAILCSPENHELSVTALMTPLLERFDKLWYGPNWASFRQEVVDSICLLRKDLLYINEY